WIQPPIFTSATTLQSLSGKLQQLTTTSYSQEELRRKLRHGVKSSCLYQH
ncbi:hypothetical protein COCMIDRAFT_86619, partial [Bipolaris oryzae ATCC 44560]